MANIIYVAIRHNGVDGQKLPVDLLKDCIGVDIGKSGVLILVEGHNFIN